MHSPLLILLAATFSIASIFMLFRWQLPTLARYMERHPHPVVLTLDLGFAVAMILASIAPLALLIPGETGRGAWFGIMAGAFFFLAATMMFALWALIIRGKEDLSRPHPHIG